MEELKSKNVVKTVESEGEQNLVIMLKKYLEQLARFASAAFEKPQHCFPQYNSYARKIQKIWTT